jgi:hypothetical protein
MLSSFSYKEFYGEDDLGSRGKRLDFFGKRFSGDGDQKSFLTSLHAEAEAG